MNSRSGSHWSLSRRFHLFLVSAVISMGGMLGAADRSDKAVDGSLFDPNHVFDVRIQMKPEDWDSLREQAYDFTVFQDERYLENLPVSPYTEFPADVTIDGELIPNVGVRKKGFLGSVNTVRPSLKLDFDEFVDDQEFRGSSRFTLQNNHTDRALVTQALASHVYALAGLPTPRCNFARVTVNGTDLGVYTHIESIKKPFLRRAFGDDSGNLYEGRLSDFRPRIVDTFEKKTNKKKNDRSDLAAVVKALESDDDQLVEQVGKVVDIDRFIDFWAVTSLIQFWDSYPGSANNFFCYHNPATGKFEFIPWAPDSAFKNDWFAVEDRPKSVFADGYLALRLYGIPEIRTRYRERMKELLDTVWKEDELLDEIQRMVDLLAPFSHRPKVAWNIELEKMRTQIQSRRTEILGEFDQPDEAWPYPPQSELSWIDIGDVTCDFSFPKLPDPTRNSVELAIAMHGHEQKFAQVRLVTVPPKGDLGNWVIIVLGMQSAEGGMGILLPVHERYLSESQPVPLDGNNIMSWLVKVDTVTNAPELKMNAYGLNWGTVQFEEIETTDGTIIKGSLKADLFKLPIH